MPIIFFTRDPANLTMTVVGKFDGSSHLGVQEWSEACSKPAALGKQYTSKREEPPNGAGKTTTLRMITTLLDPTGGEATVAGHDLARDPIGVRRSIGYVAQMGTTAPSAIVGEELVDLARLYGIDPKVAADRGRAVLADLDRDGMWTQKCGSLSGWPAGQRRRLDIAMALIHEPKRVFLDEPSTGLAPQSRANLWHHIARLRDEYGTTVFITTHYMDEADAPCDHILIIDHGTIVAEGTPEELKRRVGGDQVILSPSAVSRPTLDDVFLTLTGRSLRDDVAAA